MFLILFDVPLVAWLLGLHPMEQPESYGGVQ
jgi:hypothetical protein